CRPMEFLATGLGDYIDGGSLAATIHGRKALGANYKLLNRFERELHHRTADGVVLVVDSIDGDIDISAAGTIDPENCNAILCRIVRVHRLGPRRQISQVSEVATVKGKILDIARRDVDADVGF